MGSVGRSTRPAAIASSSSSSVRIAVRSTGAAATAVRVLVPALVDLSTSVDVERAEVHPSSRPGAGHDLPPAGSSAAAIQRRADRARYTGGPAPSGDARYGPSTRRSMREATGWRECQSGSTRSPQRVAAPTPGRSWPRHAVLPGWGDSCMFGEVFKPDGRTPGAGRGRPVDGAARPGAHPRP